MADLDHKRLFDKSPGMYLVLRPDTSFTILDATDAYLASSYTTRDIVGRGLFEVFPEPPTERTMSNLRASLELVLKTRQPQRMELQKYDLVGESGLEQRYWSPSNTPVLSDAGEVEYIIHRVEDVTEQVRDHRADNELAATEVLESMTEGFFLLDREYRFLYVNAEAQRILDSSSAELLGHTLWTAFPGLEDTEFERSYTRAMTAGEMSSFTAFYANHQHWYEVTTHPSKSGIAVYFRDVTTVKLESLERERLAAEVERDRLVYEAALSNTPDLVYVFDLQHRFIYANEALLRMWGKARDTALGKTCLELGYPDWHAEMHEREIDQVAATGKPIRGEVAFNGTDGRRMYDYIFVPVFGASDVVIAVAGTTRDITDRQRAEQDLREHAERLAAADLAKDEFLATLSHELRNPLAPLRSALFLLKTDAKDQATTASIHAMMERQVEHLVRLVDDLLELSRVSRVTFVLRREHTDLATVVQHAVEMSRPLIDAGRHTLSVELTEGPQRVDGDLVRLSQIIGNLLNNAAKYTAEGGHIWLTTRRCGDTIEVSVRDDGPGIEPSLVDKMFEMFSRGEHVNGRGPGGLGIGLSLSRRLAELHGGTLTAHSEGLGHGTDVVLRVPALEAVAEKPAPPPVQKTPVKRRVLVVDDNEDAADMLGLLLQAFGADVEVRYGGAEALDVFGAFDPSVVILDIGMPGMDGYEVARTLRPIAPGVTLVALTGWGQEDDRRRVREAGFDHHLVKPVDGPTMLTLLASLDS